MRGQGLEERRRQEIREAEGEARLAATEARMAIFEYIEMFCNRTRRDSRRGGVCPEAFEAGSNRGL